MVCVILPANPDRLASPGSDGTIAISYHADFASVLWLYNDKTCMPDKNPQPKEHGFIDILFVRFSHRTTFTRIHS